VYFQFQSLTLLIQNVDDITQQSETLSKFMKGVY